MLAGVRPRLDPVAALVDRGALFAAARLAGNLYRWFSAPDAAQRSAIGAAEQHLATLADRHSPLLGAALAAMPGALAAATGGEVLASEEQIFTGGRSRWVARVAWQVWVLAAFALFLADLIVRYGSGLIGPWRRSTA